MPWRVENLAQTIADIGPSVVSLTGGGGKTTLLYALGTALAGCGHTVLCTTTTRMCRPDVGDDRLPFQARDNADDIVMPSSGAILAARGAPPDGDPTKILGYDPEAVDRLWARRAAAWIVVEADGSARMPLKAPAEHEPVMPSLTGIVVAVVGLSCVGRPLDKNTAFRIDRIGAVTGLRPGDVITPGAVAALATHPLGLFKGTPAGAARILFCNQCDLPDALDAGKAVGEALSANGGRPAVYIGSLHRDGLACLALRSE